MKNFYIYWKQSILALFDAVWCLGLIRGWAYWRLQCRASKDPTVIPAWCDKMEKEANRMDILGKHDEADIWRDFSLDCRMRNDAFHGLNDK